MIASKMKIFKEGMCGLLSSSRSGWQNLKYIAYIGIYFSRLVKYSGSRSLQLG